MLLVPLLALTLFVFALVDIILRPSDQVRHLPKLAWVFIVILLPLIGSILWFAIGREYGPRAEGRRTVVVREARPDGARPASLAPGSIQAGSTRNNRNLSTEEQLAAVDREIAFHERQERIRQLEEEVRRRRDGAGDSTGDAVG